MNFVIRIDDVCEYLDLAKFNRLVDLLKSKGMKAYLGYIPLCEDEKLMKFGYHEEVVDWCKSLEKEGWEIAMHGTHHLYTQEGGGEMCATKSEFIGLPFDEQNKLIQKGREKLLALGFKNPNAFFAPSHGYDQNTLLALNENEFIYLLDGLNPAVIERSNLVHVPCIVDRLPFYTSLINTTHILCLHSNTMSERDFLELDLYLDQHKKYYQEPGKIELNNGFRVIGKIAEIMFKFLKNIKRRRVQWK